MASLSGYSRNITGTRERTRKLGTMACITRETWLGVTRMVTYGSLASADDVIKSSGYRIGPFEVESALMTHPAVVECAITGVPDEIRGQVVKATIVLAKDYKDKAGDALIKELQNHVKRVTAPYKYPRVVEFVDELPKTISGKIRRVEIRDKDNK